MISPRREAADLVSVATEQRIDIEGLPEPPAWMGDALCAQIGHGDMPGAGPDDGRAGLGAPVFFPEKGGSSRSAKAVCARCRVAAECLDFAMNNDERFGIWGGLSERERRKLKRRLEKAARATEERSA